MQGRNDFLPTFENKQKPSGGCRSVVLKEFYAFGCVFSNEQLEAVWDNTLSNLYALGLYLI